MRLSRQTLGICRCAHCRGSQSDRDGFKLSFAGLVAVARSLNPIPSRTRPLNSSAPMVLCLKTWESRSLPGLPKTSLIPMQSTHPFTPQTNGRATQPKIRLNAGWSSPVARQAHNLKAAGSNPAPATSINCRAPGPKGRGLFSLRGVAKLSSLCRNSLKRRL
jgi:hypothetical protein